MFLGGEGGKHNPESLAAGLDIWDCSRTNSITSPQYFILRILRFNLLLNLLY